MKIKNLEYAIREVRQKADIETMINYRVDYLKELQGNMTEEYEITLKKELYSYFAESINNGSFYALLLECDGVIISFGAMVFKRIPGDANKSFYLEADILNMYTLSQYRGRGASSLILQALIDHARKIGVSKLSLHTSKAGEPLYRKFGFQDPKYPVLELIC